ncbi:YihY/virulence factor BrkB family protein [Streptosporangium lutulentum]|uniref:Membrane protein n=1 Tax=Streptosporangium lutulentum TaxID=1461250 RepID=A0ABT9QNB1_9ACTN|nr:YihY/virulence factor BrkB family protein [Streptosporangium lutulentum]MDP9848258.1 membrane protein [Streptosporangium lutulentum]
MMVTGFTGRVAMAWSRARRRHGWLDHLVRAVVRYDEVDAGRLSAALTYYSFFAVFALGLLGFAIIGQVLDDPEVLRTVQGYLAENLPRLDVQALQDARSTAGAIAFVGLPLTGLFWMDALRSAIRAIWRIEEYPGRFFVRQLIDLGVMAGLGLLLSASLAVAFAAETSLNWLLLHTVGVEDTSSQWLLSAVAFVLGLGVNTLLAIALLCAPPRLRLSLRRVLGPALLITFGLEILKTIGQFYLELTAANPAYQVVAGAVGMLVFLKILNQLILFAATLTATSTKGRITDLADRTPSATSPESPSTPSATSSEPSSPSSPLSATRPSQSSSLSATSSESPSLSSPLSATRPSQPSPSAPSSPPS